MKDRNKTSIFLISNEGKVLKTIEDSLLLADDTHGNTLSLIIEKLCKTLFDQLLNILLKDESECMLSINDYSGSSHAYILRKKISDNKIFFEIRKDELINNELEQEFLRLENEKINLCRLELKRTEEEKSFFQKKYLEVLEEMSRLNNELLNTQRELYKKNLQLEVATNSLKELNLKLQRLALCDPLTGVYNRWYLHSVFNREITIAKRQNYKLVLALLDLNNLKFINDTYGHIEGDRMLKNFSHLIQKNIRKNYDYVFRLGGDEFVILFINSNISDAEKIMERIKNQMKKDIETQLHQFSAFKNIKSFIIQ
ncbi:GGDEF domain-containing protein [Thermodesulfovibrio hydrogeniphilus]